MSSVFLVIKIDTSTERILGTLLSPAPSPFLLLFIKSCNQEHPIKGVRAHTYSKEAKVDRKINLDYIYIYIYTFIPLPHVKHSYF